MTRVPPETPQPWYESPPGQPAQQACGLAVASLICGIAGAVCCSVTGTSSGGRSCPTDAARAAARALNSAWNRSV